jgi:hypothetical protein
LLAVWLVGLITRRPRRGLVMEITLGLWVPLMAWFVAAMLLGITNPFAGLNIGVTLAAFLVALLAVAAGRLLPAAWAWAITYLVVGWSLGRLAVVGVTAATGPGVLASLTALVAAAAGVALAAWGYTRAGQPR